MLNSAKKPFEFGICRGFNLNAPRKVQWAANYSWSKCSCQLDAREKMGFQSKMKESHRKLRRMHQRRIAKYYFFEFSDVFQVDVDGPIADQDEDLELGEIIKWLMPDLPSF